MGATDLNFILYAVGYVAVVLVIARAMGIAGQ